MASARGPRARAHAWPLGPAATALLLVASAATGATGAVLLHRASDQPDRAVTTQSAPYPARAGALSGDASWAPGRRPAPLFVLRDQANRRGSLRRPPAHPAPLP